MPVTVFDEYPIDPFRNTKKIIEDSINIQTSKPKKDIKTFQISKEEMEKFEFNVRHTRLKRRELARKGKLNWRIYQLVEKEIERRIDNNLDIYTGAVNNTSESTNDGEVVSGM